MGFALFCDFRLSSLVLGRVPNHLSRVVMKKPMISPILSFVAAFLAISHGIRAHFRIPSYLHSDTVLSAGRQVPVEQFARFDANASYSSAIFFFVFGVFGVLLLTEANRRYIAQLPRWQQWLFWPFHGIAPSAASSQHASTHRPRNDTFQ